MTDSINARAQAVKLLLLDVDGVLTDGKLYFDNQHNEMKTFCTLDGHGVKMLQRAGIRVGIITGRSSELVARRARDLGITLLIQGREDKWQALSEILPELQIESQEIAYMGDDWPDLTVMLRVGLALTVPNAHTELLERAHWTSSKTGGTGAVREACELILKAQDKYTEALRPYL